MGKSVSIDLDELLAALSDSERQKYFVEEFDFFDEAQPSMMVKLFGKMCDADKEEAIVKMLVDMDGNAHHAIVEFIKCLPMECWKEYAHLGDYLK